MVVQSLLRCIGSEESQVEVCRLEGGAMKHEEHAHHEDMGGFEAFFNTDGGFDDEQEEVCSQPEIYPMCTSCRYCADASRCTLALQDEGRGDGGRPAAGVKRVKGQLGPKTEVDFDCFLTDIWPNITNKKDKQTLTASLVWQVFLCGVPWTHALQKLLSLSQLSLHIVMHHMSPLTYVMALACRRSALS